MLGVVILCNIYNFITPQSYEASVVQLPLKSLLSLFTDKHTIQDYQKSHIFLQVLH